MRRLDTLILALGCVLGAFVPPITRAPTAISYDGSMCAPGVYSLESTARGLNGDVQIATVAGVTLPVPMVTQAFTNLFQQPYVVTTRVLQGGVVQSAAMATTVMGAGDPLPPVITPTPTVTPQGLPCNALPTVTDAAQNVWTLVQGQTAKNGVIVTGQGTGYLLVAGIAYVYGTDQQWYKRVNEAWELFGVSCPVAPTPTPTPTVTPNPQEPTHSDLMVKLVQILSLITPLPPPPAPATIDCVVKTVNTATVTCAIKRGDVPTVQVGQILKVIK